MAVSNSAWGIEIGAGGIKGVKVSLDGETARVLDFIAIEHPKVLSTPDVDKDDVLRVSLGRLVNERDLTGSTILVSIPGHQSFARFAKLPPVEPKKIPDIVKFEAVQQVPFPLDEVEWDYQTFVSPDSPEVEVGIFAVTKERVKAQLGMLADVGINPDGLTLSPLAVFNAMAHDLEFTEKSQGTIILDIGTTATDLIISEAGRVWIRTFPMGGHNFTNQLVESFKLGYPKAEKLKREADQSQHARHILQAMRPVFTDLAQDVQRSIGYYQSLHKDANLTRLIGLGATFHLPGLRKYLKQQLGMEVYRLEEWKRPILTDLGEEKTKQFQDSAMEMSTAYGLALQGIGLQAIDANLIPAAVVRESLWRKKVKWFGMAAGIGLVAAGAMFVRPILDQQAIAAAEGNAETQNTIRQTINTAQRLKSEAEQARVTGQAQVDPRASRVVSLLTGRDMYTYLLSDVSTMLEDAERVRPGFAASAGLSVLPEGPGWVVNSIQTEYLPDGRFAPAAGSTMGPSQDRYPDKARIEVTMQVTTWMPQFERFVVATLPRWLEDNTDRPGMPYRIVPQGVDPPKVLTARPVANPAGGETGTEIASLPGQTTGRRDRPERGGEPNYAEQNRGPTREEMDADLQRRIAAGEVTVTGQGASTQSNVGRDAGSLDGLAPIDKPKSNESFDRVTYTIRWLMVLDPVPAADANGASAGEGGGR